MMAISQGRQTAPVGGFELRILTTGKGIAIAPSPPISLKDL